MSYSSFAQVLLAKLYSVIIASRPQARSVIRRDDPINEVPEKGTLAQQTKTKTGDLDKEGWNNAAEDTAKSKHDIQEPAINTEQQTASLPLKGCMLFVS